MEPPEGGWLFRYVEDPADDLSKMLGRPPPMRPAVAVRLIDQQPSPRVVSLVDSGSERTLASPALARAIGVDLTNAPEGRIHIGGGGRDVRFATVRLELYHDVLNDAEPPLDEWEAEVGFFDKWSPAWPVLLGGVGFFDRYTVVMHRAAMALVLESWRAFDDRHGTIWESVDDSQPRFRP
jgi:hypothetical protein